MGLSWWERRWAAYDEATYRAAAAYLNRDDVVLDIGAGDLRFATAIAPLVQQVFAVELQRHLLDRVVIPPNLTVICADARHWSYPQAITTAVLLMRHCDHLSLYIRRLRQVGCRRLVTNARWGVGVECIDLSPKPSLSVYQDQGYTGWYACLCGQVGFWATDSAAINTETLQSLVDVEQCPRCLKDVSTNRGRST